VREIQHCFELTCSRNCRRMRDNSTSGTAKATDRGQLKPGIQARLFLAIASMTGLIRCPSEGDRHNLRRYQFPVVFQKVRIAD
jgi:hypothetical protein